MFQQPVDQLQARVLFGCGRVGIRRQQHPRLDVNEQRRRVNELGGNIHIEALHGLHVAQILLGDFGDRDVVDVNVLLANEVEQQIEWAVVDLTDDDGEGGLVWAFVGVNV